MAEKKWNPYTDVPFEHEDPDPPALSKEHQKRILESFVNEDGTPFDPDKIAGAEPQGT